MAPVLITYLEMLDPAALRPAAEPVSSVDLTRVVPPSGARSRDFYLRVGDRWAWTDRHPWSGHEWQSWAELVETWVLTEDGVEAGYGELESHPGGQVQIAFLGLLPGFEGRGLGGWMLSELVRRAWALGDTRRVWLHTGSQDSAAALPNYRARGFTVFERREVDR